MRMEKKKKIIQMEKDKKEGGYKNALSKKKKWIKEMKEQKQKQEQPKVKIAAGQRQYQEALKQIEKQESPVKTLATQNANLLQKLFYIYFKILKSEKISKFFQAAMDGILKYVHLINIELIMDIIKQLKETCTILRDQSLIKQEQQLKEKALLLRFSTIYTVNEIIEGPGRVFEVDDKQICILLFQLILDLSEQKSYQYFDFATIYFQDKLITLFTKDMQQILLKLLEKLFLLKRLLASEIVASFLKASLQLLKLVIKKVDFKGFIYAMLIFFAKLILKYPKLQQMFDEDNEGCGLDAYCEHVKDPSLTNAINSCVNSEIKTILQITNDKEIQSLLTKLKNAQTIVISYLSLDLIAVFQKNNE